MKFFVATPSYNQLEWLRLCIASVADQAVMGARGSTSYVDDRVEVHHHVQDGGSNDGTREYLAKHLMESQKLKSKGYTFTYESMTDNGMYDAINKGWKLAPDDVDFVAHLNCDEQYLPGALKIIAAFFEKHQKADVVLADMIVVDKNGEYICHRRSLKPYPSISKLWCAGYTATTFQRAVVVKEKNVFFDTKWKNIGDKAWYNDLHRAGCRFGMCHEFVSVFSDTGENLNWMEQGRTEGLKYMDEFLPFMRKRMGLLKFLSRYNTLRRIVKERVHAPPRSYELYLCGSKPRIVKNISKPSALWSKKVW